MSEFMFLIDLERELIVNLRVMEYRRHIWGVFAVFSRFLSDDMSLVDVTFVKKGRLYVFNMLAVDKTVAFGFIWGF